MSELGYAGDYELIELLGQGGMAEVHLAYKYGAVGFSKPVAIKRILIVFGKYSDLHEHYFIWEALTVSRMAHPNIVSVLDFFEDVEGRLNIVMEYVDGIDLATLLALLGGAPLPENVAIFVAIETFKALHYAHNLRFKGSSVVVLHRDVSPHNIMVSRDGHVKLNDFGIAKVLDRLMPNQLKVKTEGNSFRGKPPYASAEALKEVSDLDERTDIYSTGISTYEFLTGKPAFKPGNSAFVHVIDGTMEPLEKANSRISRKLAKVMRSLYALDRDSRPRSADEAIRLLQPFCPDFIQAQKDLVTILQKTLPKPRTTQPFEVDPEYHRLIRGIVKGRVDSDLAEKEKLKDSRHDQSEPVTADERKGSDSQAENKQKNVPEPVDNALTEKANFSELLGANVTVLKDAADDAKLLLKQMPGETEVSSRANTDSASPATRQVIRRKRTIPLEAKFSEEMKQTRGAINRSEPSQWGKRASWLGRGAVLGLAIVGLITVLKVSFSSHSVAPHRAAEPDATVPSSASPPTPPASKLTQTAPARKVDTQVATSKRTKQRVATKVTSIHVVALHEDEEVNVAVDGIFLGRTPVFYELDPGNHRLRVYNKTKQREKNYNIYLKSGQALEYSY